jgi:hypothetical protein
MVSIQDAVFLSRQRQQAVFLLNVTFCDVVDGPEGDVTVRNTSTAMSPLPGSPPCPQGTVGFATTGFVPDARIGPVVFTSLNT